MRALPVLLLSLTALPGFGAPVSKTHTVVLGGTRRVSYTQPDATPEAQVDLTTTIKVRPLIIDGRQRDWTTGNIHEVTDRTFAVRRALRVNDALATDTSPRWIWQPGPWITVDRITGHITALHLPDFDPLVSDAVWFRDYVAYCGTATTAKGARLYVIVAQLGARRARRTEARWTMAAAGSRIAGLYPRQMGPTSFARHGSARRRRKHHLRCRGDLLHHRRGRQRRLQLNSPQLVILSNAKNPCISRCQGPPHLYFKMKPACLDHIC